MGEYIPNSPAALESSPYNLGGRNFEVEVKILESEFRDNPDFKRLIESLKGNERVLDFGSGLGSGFVRFLRNHNLLAGKLVSLDLDFSNLKFQKDNANDVKNLLVQADAAAVPLSSQSFDIIVEVYMRQDNNGTENKKDRIDTEIKRLLVPGGLLVLDEPGTYPDPNEFDKVCEVPWRLKIYRRKIAPQSQV